MELLKEHETNDDPLKYVRQGEFEKALKEKLIQKDLNPDAIIHDVPVLPPSLRPVYPLGDGRFASSDLNDLYRRIIIRNNRTQKLIELKSPIVIIVNEIRMEQESIDSLVYNPASNGDNPSLKGLLVYLQEIQSKIFKKKTSYAGKATVVPDPTLPEDLCSMPVGMALSLFEPFVCRNLMFYIYSQKRQSFKGSRREVLNRTPRAIEEMTEIASKSLILASAANQKQIAAFKVKINEAEVVRLHSNAIAKLGITMEKKERKILLYTPLGSESVKEIENLVQGKAKEEKLISFSSSITLNEIDFEAIAQSGKKKTKILSPYDELIFN